MSPCAEQTLCGVSAASVTDPETKIKPDEVYVIPCWSLLLMMKVPNKILHDEKFMKDRRFIEHQAQDSSSL